MIWDESDTNLMGFNFSTCISEITEIPSYVTSFDINILDFYYQGLTDFSSIITMSSLTYVDVTGNILITELPSEICTLAANPCEIIVSEIPSIPCSEVLLLECSDAIECE